MQSVMKYVSIGDSFVFALGSVPEQAEHHVSQLLPKVFLFQKP